MLCRAKTSSVSQVGLDAATDSVLFFPTGGVSFCSGVDRARGSFGEPKVTPPFLVYTLSDVTSDAGRNSVRNYRHTVQSPMSTLIQEEILFRNCRHTPGPSRECEEAPLT